jgi:hypothetical protein
MTVSTRWIMLNLLATSRDPACDRAAVVVADPHGA